MESYLGVAADVQNGRAKPWWPLPGERSQGGAAMRCHEEASSLDLTGGHVSQNEGRVSPLGTKPSLLVPRSSRPTSNAVRWLGGMVRPALMSGKRFVSLTDEVPRGSSVHSTIWIYKAQPKCSSHASAAGTATPWPRPQGCLQSQSTSPIIGDRKAKPQSELNGRVDSWDKLASAKKRSRRSTFLSTSRAPGGDYVCPVGTTPRSRGIALPCLLTGIARSQRAPGVAWCGKSARQTNTEN